VPADVTPQTGAKTSKVMELFSAYDLISGLAAQSVFNIFPFGLFVIGLCVMVCVFRAPEFNTPFFHQLFETVDQSSRIIHYTPFSVSFTLLGILPGISIMLAFMQTRAHQNIGLQRDSPA
jgi:hypothetical protein